MGRFFEHKPLVIFILAVTSVITLSVFAFFGSPELRALPSSLFSSLPAAVVLPGNNHASTTAQTPLFEYIEVMEGCGPYWEGECVNMRSGPGVAYPSVGKLRTGVVLKVADTVIVDGRTWYKIGFSTELHYPERVAGDLFVAAEVVRLFLDDGDHVLAKGQSVTTTKRIVVDASEQMLYAYDGDTLFMQEPISTGLEFTPTPKGTFTIFKMTPSRYMQGPTAGVSDQYYDLPGVPWDLYFTTDGAVIHGAYWHDHFGEPCSHGCVNLPPQKAKELYMWAEVGMSVTVQR